jgi:hypothetical protein
MTIKKILGIAILGLGLAILIGVIGINIAKADTGVAQLQLQELSHVAQNDLDAGLSPLTDHLLSSTLERRHLPVSRGLGQHANLLTSLHTVRTLDLSQHGLDLLGLES